MSDNNLPNIDGNEEKDVNSFEETNETVDETLENVLETGDDITEDTDETDGIDDSGEVENDEIDSDVYTSSGEGQVLTKSTSAPVVVCIILALALIASVLTGGFSKIMGNKYNAMGYGTPDDMTVKEVAKAMDMDLKTFLEKAHLPKNLPGSTKQSAALYGCLPAGEMAKLYGMTFDEIKERLELPETVTEETLWGEAEGQSPLRAYLGGTQIDTFKTQYGLSDDVTEDTLWKDVMVQVTQNSAKEQVVGQWEQIISTIGAEGETEQGDTLDDVDVPDEEEVPQTDAEAPEATASATPAE